LRKCYNQRRILSALRMGKEVEGMALIASCHLISGAERILSRSRGELSTSCRRALALLLSLHTSSTKSDSVVAFTSSGTGCVSDDPHCCLARLLCIHMVQRDTEGVQSNRGLFSLSRKLSSTSSPQLIHPCVKSQKRLNPKASDDFFQYIYVSLSLPTVHID
jgi:hypothetical protein